MNRLSIVLPAKNEAEGLSEILPELLSLYPEAEIVVVDDGSTDNTAEIIKKYDPVIRVHHPQSIGNGAAIKSGARASSGDFIVFMDADGQHDPKDIESLLAPLNDGYDMVVGARSRMDQASLLRAIANGFFNWLASMMTGFKIEDLTSGFRAVRKDKFLNILYLLPNKFSYPTTSTMAFFRNGYFVQYKPINVKKRPFTQESHIKIFRDGTRFLIIILKVGALFSPMRFFLPISATLFCFATGLYIYTYLTAERFTNMGMLLYLSALSTFLIGILSEQIAALHYRGTGTDYSNNSIRASAPIYTIDQQTQSIPEEVYSNTRTKLNVVK